MNENAARVGRWSARRHRVNDRVTAAQSYATIVGYTEGVDDRRTLEEWATVLSAHVGRVASSIMVYGEKDVVAGPHNQVETDAVMLASMCHSFLEYLDRKRDTQ